ncbi:MAG: desulfoferrodoxin [bacterium]
MTELFQVYRCEICGNIVDVAHASGGQLTCCNQAMTLQVEKTSDQGQEKHLPVMEKKGDGLTVTVGSVHHPMEEKHFIEWIELISADGLSRKYLKPGQTPQSQFAAQAKLQKVRAYCNIHGLWSIKGS